MNITFIIGNGFDAAQDLHTKYEEFYPFFLENTDENNVIRKSIEEDKTSNYKNWSDLEFALGQFTAGFDEKNVQSFIGAKIELDKKLREYLKIQEEKFVLEENDDKLQCALANIRKTKVENDNQKIEKLFNTYKAYDLDYKAITFNYTNAIDKVWNVLKNKEVGKQNVNGTVYTRRVRTLLHVHGTLYDNEMIVGINDASQIENTALRAHKKLLRVLLKPLLNETIGQNKITKAKGIIDGSAMICLYGGSIGATDRMWWEHIGNWLKGSTNRLLMIYNYEPEFQGDHIFEIIEHRDAVKTKFLDMTSLTEKEKERCQEQIIVRDNENLFGKGK